MVDVIKWDDSCRVGVRELDEAHKGLFDVCNHLIRIVVENRVSEMGGPIVEKLIDYAERHFQREEELMRLAQYPGVDEHHGEHKTLMNDVFLFKSDYIAGNLDASAVSEFLIKWILHHVKGTDRDYAEQLHAKGIF